MTTEMMTDGGPGPKVEQGRGRRIRLFNAVPSREPQSSKKVPGRLRDGLGSRGRIYCTTNVSFVEWTKLTELDV